MLFVTIIYTYFLTAKTISSNWYKMWIFFLLLVGVSAEYKYSSEYPCNSDDEARILKMLSFIDLPQQYPVIIDLMPKGAVLSLDIINLLGDDYIMSNITRRENLYICNEDKFDLRFSDGKNLEKCFKTIELARAEERIEMDFEFILRREITLTPDHRSLKNVNKRVQYILDLRKRFLLYKPVFHDYIWELLSELYKKKYIYVEFKGPLYQLYDLDGTKYSEEETLKILNEINTSFKGKHTTFFGFRYIIESNDIDKFNTYKNMYPDLITGLHTTDIDKAFAEKIANKTKIFLSINDLTADTSIPNKFFQEIERFECTDGFFGNPILIKLKKYNVPVEIYPVDNLKMYRYLNSYDYNVVVIPKYDDLAYAYTFLVTDDLKKNYRYYKRLFQNSISFSTLPPKERSRAFETWEDQWYEMMSYLISLGH